LTIELFYDIIENMKDKLVKLAAVGFLVSQIGCAEKDKPTEAILVDDIPSAFTYQIETEDKVAKREAEAKEFLAKADSVLLKQIADKNKRISKDCPSVDDLNKTHPKNVECARF